MARGFGARESSLYSKIDSNFVPAPEAVRKNAVDMLVSDEATKSKLSELAAAVKWQQINSKSKVNGSESEKADVKANKLKIAELARTLPAEIRDAIELPREAIEMLYRGVHDKNITETSTWKNGNFVYGFTPSYALAESYRKEGTGKLLTDNDIESFGGLLSTDRLFRLVMEYNKRVWGDDKSFVPSAGRPLEPDKEKGVPYKKRYDKYQEKAIKTSFNSYPGEKEVLVYDIKFKRYGDRFYAE